MAQVDIYIDTYSGKSVKGITNTEAAPLPKFVQGDTISLRIYLLSRNPTHPTTNPYSVILNTTLSLKVALGPKNGTASSTLYTQQYTWSKSANNDYFYASLPLNTAAIATLIGSAESASAWFEVEYTENGLPTTALQESVTIHAEVIEAGSLTTPAGETPISAETASATFLKIENYGFYLVNESTGHKVFVYLGDDDTVHFDPVT